METGAEVETFQHRAEPKNEKAEWRGLADSPQLPPPSPLLLARLLSHLCHAVEALLVFSTGDCAPGSEAVKQPSRYGSHGKPRALCDPV